ncbi:MAG: hypothetical protein Q4Q62_02420, partial [Thermoplasmata archaeon]|nr:hypothetical protein [Thermoplasmata archaeon]
PAEEPEAEPEEEAPADVPAVEDAPAETPADAPAATPSETPSEEPAPAEEEEALGEDLYTDNSPEALVRRAAWNKGLRCRRGYGERNIPVAFVKGKVAVYVDEPGADTSVDEELRAEGWTVLRYNAADVTDGKAQGDEIAAAVKANTRASKKKGRK